MHREPILARERAPAVRARLQSTLGRSPRRLVVLLPRLGRPFPNRSIVTGQHVEHLGRRRRWPPLFALILLRAFLEVDLKRRRAKLATTKVTKRKLLLLARGLLALRTLPLGEPVRGLSLRIGGPLVAPAQVHWQAIRQELPLTVWAWDEVTRPGAVGGFVVRIDLFGRHAFTDGPILAQKGRGHRRWRLAALALVLFCTRLHMDGEGCGAKLTAADMANGEVGLPASRR